MMQDATFYQMAAPNFENNAGAIGGSINAGAGTNLANFSEYIPQLQFAAKTRNLGLITYILERGAYRHINSQTSYGQTALHFAICNHEPHTPPDYAIVHRLLQCIGININAMDYNSCSPLLLAVQKNSLEIVELLLFNGANPNIGRNVNGGSCLHVALSHAFPNYIIVRQLIWKGADIYHKNHFGSTPLDILIRRIKNYHDLRFAMRCCKVIVLTWEARHDLMFKLQAHPELLNYVYKCYEEVARMKNDNISGNFTLYHFITYPFKEESCIESVLKIYKPVVEKLVHGFYIEYFYDIFDRIEDSYLYVIAETIICPEVVMKRIIEGYPRLVGKMDLGICKFLSRLDIFYLIVAFSNVRIVQPILDLKRRGLGLL